MMQNSPRILLIAFTLACVSCGGSARAPITISVSDVTVTEGTGAAYSIALSGTSSTSITVGYTTQDGSATNPTDYRAASGTFTFNAGQISRELIVSVIDDGRDEEDENFTLVLSNPTNAQLDNSVASTTIIDNDDPPTLQLNFTGFAGDEGPSPGQTLQVPISLGAIPSEKPVSVQLTLVGESATEGEDFPITRAQVVNIPPGSLGTVAEVTIIGDEFQEFDESFSVRLANPENATLGTSDAQVIVYNDDGPPVTELFEGFVIFDLEVSQDSNFVVFTNYGIQLGDGIRDVYLYDRVNQTTTIVGAPSPTNGLNCCSSRPRMNSDGRYIVYISELSNLVPGDNNNVTDTFLFDRVTGVVTRVSVAEDGSEAVQGGGIADISDDGNVVAFTAASNNLTPEDTGGFDQVFSKNLSDNSVQLISLNGNAAGNGNSRVMDVSANGQFILFVSDASNLVVDDNNDVSDLFLRDRVNNTTELLSRDLNNTPSDHSTSWGRMSSNANFIVFDTAANGLIPDDSDGDTDSFLLDRITATLTRLSVDVEGTNFGVGNDISVTHPTISRTGRFVGFTSYSPFPFGLNPGNFPKQTLYILDVQTGNTIEGAMLRRNGSDRYIDAFNASFSDDGQWIGYIAMTPGISRIPVFQLRGPFQLN